MKLKSCFVRSREERQPVFSVVRFVFRAKIIAIVVALIVFIAIFVAVIVVISIIVVASPLRLRSLRLASSCASAPSSLITFLTASQSSPSANPLYQLQGAVYRSRLMIRCFVSSDGNSSAWRRNRRGVRRRVVLVLPVVLLIL